MYAFLDSQTLRLINQGLTPTEIAAKLATLPPRLAGKWYSRDYYGSLSHNVRAVYQRYMGFYDGNPANLDPLPPEEAGKRYVEAMGGPDAVLAGARKAVEGGDYRWAAQLLNHLVFAEPDNQAARELQADTLEQLGYQSENATWRNVYLSGALELRQGVARAKARNSAPDMIRALTPSLFFDYLAVRIDAMKAADEDLLINWRFSDLGEDYALTLRNGVLTHRNGARHAKPDVSLSMTKALLDRIALKETGFLKESMIGGIEIDQGRIKLLRLLGGLDEPNPQFNLVTPETRGLPAGPVGRVFARIGETCRSEFSGVGCVSCCGFNERLKNGAFRAFLDSWHTHRMGFASLYTILRKPPAAAFTRWWRAHQCEVSSTDVGAIAKRPFQEAERNRRFRG